jgi:transposase InsO family protein/transposase-like protein
MYSLEDRQKAVDLYIKSDLSAADVVCELGYPSKRMLKLWYREYRDSGSLHEKHRAGYWKYTAEQKQVAVDYYLEHGKSLSRTIRAVGYPTRETLTWWIDELVPGQRKTRMEAGAVQFSQEQKRAAVIDLCSRKKTASEVATEHNTTREAIYNWRYKMLGKEVLPTMPKDKRCDIPDDVDGLRDEVSKLKADVGSLLDESNDLRRQIYRLQLEKDILEGTVEIVKKDPGADPKSLTNKEKAILIGALRTIYPLNDLLVCLKIAKSSYFYQVGAMSAPDKYADLRVEVRSEFKASDSVYGYRRIHGRVTRGGTVISEKVVRNIMAEEGLVVIVKSTKRKYNSYKGEISPEVPNVIERNFHADNPNVKWLTDLTEFHIPAGKVYLSPVIDCFDGLAVSWTIGTSPNAALVNTMLDNAIAELGDGERPLVHHDRGCHYRWPGWIQKMEGAGLVNSMSKKGCSPDNSACEGFFGRLKNEFFYDGHGKGSASMSSSPGLMPSCAGTMR